MSTDLFETATSYQVTNFFAGGEKKREEMLAEPAGCNCSCACGVCTCNCSCVCNCSMCNCVCNCDCDCSCNCDCDDFHVKSFYGDPTYSTEHDTTGTPGAAQFGDSIGDATDDQLVASGYNSTGTTQHSSTAGTDGNQASRSLFDGNATSLQGG